MTDSNTIQCIPVTIASDSNTEDTSECFTYTISTTSIPGLTLSPTTATVCISDEEESKISFVNCFILCCNCASLPTELLNIIFGIVFLQHLTHTAMTSPVTIGLQQSFYSTVEGQGPVDVCIEVLSGDITGNSFTISYSTSNGLAEGKHSLQSSLHTF